MSIASEHTVCQNREEKIIEASQSDGASPDQVNPPTKKAEVDYAEIDRVLSTLDEDDSPRVPGRVVAPDQPQKPAQQPVSQTPVQSADPNPAETKPARVFDELAFAPGCFGSALHFDSSEPTCLACAFGVKCQPVHEKAKERLLEKFAVVVPTKDVAQPKIVVLTRDDHRRLQKRESYHRCKPERVRANLSEMTPEQKADHKRAKERDKKARQRAEKKAAKAAAPSGGPKITEGMF